MADMAMSAPVVVTSDGIPLKKKLAIATRRARLRALLLTLPLLIFVLVTFIVPIGQLLTRSVYNPTFADNMPRVTEAIKAWDGEGLPDDSVFKAMAEDLAQAREDRTIGRVATRVNYELSGTRSLFTGAARRAGRIGEVESYKDALIDIRKDWGERDLWSAIKRVADPVTPAFYLASIDRRVSADGDIVEVEEQLQIYVPLFWRTLWLSAVITILCLLLAYPVSFLLSTLPTRYSNLLMILVLLPFWTSLLVRTTAWIAMLQSQGIVNDILVWLGIIADEQRLQMMYNRTGTIVAMTHILLPFMILPLFSVMKTIPPSYMRAARSLGATPFTAFVRVYFPQTLPGIAAGTLLVFILAVGYYITPALVGGQTGQLISNLIAFHMQRSLNWSFAAALGGILLGGVLILYWLYNRIIGGDGIKLG